MLVLRRLLCGCFSFLALIFLLVSVSTVPHILHPAYPHAYLHTPRGTVAMLLGKLVLALPLPLGALYGMASWTVTRGKPGARAWAIAASVTLLLLCVPVTFVTIYVAKHASFRQMPGNFLIFNAIALAFGIAGLVAFGPRDAAAASQRPPKPPRIAGDGTSQLLDVLVSVLSFAGYVAAMRWWWRWGQAHRLVHRPNGLLLIAAALLISVALHEAGHTLVGLALGMRLRAFIVGPFQWRIRNGKWKFQFIPAKFLSAGGATALVPTDPQQSREKWIGMIAAGPLANLCTGLIAAGTVLMAKGRPYEHAWGFLAMFATMSLITFAVNLIPIRPDSTYSDGAKIFQILSGGPWADYHQAISNATSSLVTPLRPRDYDIQTIQRAALTFTTGFQGLMLRLFMHTHFLDLGRVPEAAYALAQAEEVLRESALDITAGLHTVFVFGNAYTRRDAAAARSWWERMQAKKPTDFNVDYWRAKSALHWIEGNLQEAEEAWKKSNDLAQQLPVAGAYDFDRHCCGLLRRALDQAAMAKVAAAR
jgi:hypothetical protein